MPVAGDITLPFGSAPLQTGGATRSGSSEAAMTAMTQGLADDVVCRNVRKIYGAGKNIFEAIRSVTFSVKEGEFVSILGPSGCGKSTLLMMIAGLEGITGGTINVGGRPVERPRTEMGIMFQDPTLLPWKTAVENVLFPIDMMRRPRKQYQERALELLRLTGLAGCEHKKPRQLSGGMRQRVSICRVLVSNPRVLLMDEPFSALDAITRDEMNVVLLEIWQKYRKTAVFVTHSIREAVLLSDRVLVMGGSPSTIVSDVSVPFGRPRDFALGETSEFNHLCAMLRDQIEHAHVEREFSAVPARPALVTGAFDG
jgi:NitT/TauT family transport system ATP-binding protein